MFTSVEISTKSIFNCLFWFIVFVIIVLALISYSLAISLSLIPANLVILGPLIASAVAFIFYKLALRGGGITKEKEPEEMDNNDSDITEIVEEEVGPEIPAILVQASGAVTRVHHVTLSTNLTPCSPIKNNFLMPPLPKSGSTLPPVMSPFSTQSVLSVQNNAFR